MGEVAAVLEAIFEGARRAGDGVGEAVGEARAAWGRVGEAVVGVAGELSRSGVWVRQAVAWRTAAAC